MIDEITDKIRAALAEYINYDPTRVTITLSDDDFRHFYCDSIENSSFYVIGLDAKYISGVKSFTYNGIHFNREKDNV